MEFYEIIKNTNTKEKFVELLKILSEDYKRNKKEWEEKNIGEYLESIQSWVEDIEGYYENKNQEIPKNINWNFITTLLYVGKIYE